MVWWKWRNNFSYFDTIDILKRRYLTVNRYQSMLANRVDKPLRIRCVSLHCSALRVRQRAPDVTGRDRAVVYIVNSLQDLISYRSSPRSFFPAPSLPRIFIDAPRDSQVDNPPRVAPSLISDAHALSTHSSLCSHRSPASSAIR